MLYQRLHVVIIHRYFFLGGLWLLVGCPNFSFYYIEVTLPRIYLRKKKWDTLKKPLLHWIITNQQPTNETQPF